MYFVDLDLGWRSQGQRKTDGLVSCILLNTRGSFCSRKCECKRVKSHSNFILPSYCSRERAPGDSTVHTFHIDLCSDTRQLICRAPLNCPFWLKLVWMILTFTQGYWGTRRPEPVHSCGCTEAWSNSNEQISAAPSMWTMLMHMTPKTACIQQSCSNIQLSRKDGY